MRYHPETIARINRRILETVILEISPRKNLGFENLKGE